MYAYKDMVREYSYTAGTGAVTLSGAVPGYVSFSDAGITNGTTVYYEIKNGANIEHGVGTWGTGGILTRTTPAYTLTAGVVDDTTPTALTLVGTSEVMISLTSKLIDDIFALPKSFGSTTPAAGAFTTLSVSGTLTAPASATIGATILSGVALSTTIGAKLSISNATYTDTATAGSGTVAHGTVVSLDNPAIAATNASVTYTNASTLYIDGAPTNGSNVTITNAYAMYIAAGTSFFGGAINYGGVVLANSVTGTGSMVLSISPTITGTLTANDNAVIGDTTFSGVALSTTISAKLATGNATYTDTATAGSGTVTHGTINSFDNPAIAATNASVTYTNASTLYIDGAPTNGANVTITNPYAVYVAGGKAHFGGAVNIVGDVTVSKTITAPATTGAQTIDKTAGSVNFAAAAASLVVTNSLVATSSVIIATVATNDTTMLSVQAVAAAGSFTLYANAAANAETRVNFIVVN
jgi:hypothetical protein